MEKKRIPTLEEWLEDKKGDEPTKSEKESADAEEAKKDEDLENEDDEEEQDDLEEDNDDGEEKVKDDEEVDESKEGVNKIIIEKNFKNLSDDFKEILKLYKQDDKDPEIKKYLDYCVNIINNTQKLL